jgi:hypothetical protein
MEGGLMDSREAEGRRRRGDDDMLVELEARGYAHAAVGAEIGASERTVQRRAAEPAIAARITRRRAELFTESMQRLVGLSTRAHTVVEETLESDRGFEAARFVLGMIPRLHQLLLVERELKDLRAEVAQLRAEMNGGQS